jgi:hypothetical protein
MADQHRRLIEIADQLLVVIDDLLHSEAGRRLGGLTDPLDIPVLPWPLRRGHGEAALAEVLRVVLPAPCREPRPVNEDQRDLADVRMAAVVAHGDSLG